MWWWMYNLSVGIVYKCITNYNVMVYWVNKLLHRQNKSWVVYRERKKSFFLIEEEIWRKESESIGLRSTREKKDVVNGYGSVENLDLRCCASSGFKKDKRYRRSSREHSFLLKTDLEGNVADGGKMRVWNWK